MIDGVELRIGNLVYVQYMDTGKELLIKLGIADLATMDQKPKNVPIDYKRIHLTNSWVERAGYSKMSFKISNALVFQNGRFRVLSSDAGFFFTNDALASQYIRKIHFVDTLQNLHFYCSGKELDPQLP